LVSSRFYTAGSAATRVGQRIGGPSRRLNIATDKILCECEADELSFVIANNGIGPAEIKKVAKKFGPECAFLTHGGRERFEEKLFMDTRHDIGNWFIDPLDQLLQKSVWEPTTRKMHVRPLVPGQVIAVGERVVMFELER
jgi:hypothetical protein